MTVEQFTSPIQVLGLSQRTIELMERHCIYRIADLAPVDERAILRWPGAGPRTVQEIKNALKRWYKAPS